MAASLDDIDRTRTHPTALDTWEVQVCDVLNEPDMTFLRALKMANRVEEPEKVIRYYRAAIEVRKDAAASAFLYRLCRLLDENPEVQVHEFGGAYLMDAWVEEEKYLVEMIRDRIGGQNPGLHSKEGARRDAWTRARRERSSKSVNLDQVMDVLEDLALRYAEKAGGESSNGNPRGMRQELWKSKGIVEAADLLRKMFRS
jgi:hypothetical protein